MDEIEDIDQCNNEGEVIELEDIDENEEIGQLRNEVEDIDIQNIDDNEEIIQCSKEDEVLEIQSIIENQEIAKSSNNMEEIVVNKNVVAEPEEIVQCSHNMEEIVMNENVETIVERDNKMEASENEKTDECRNESETSMNENVEIIEDNENGSREEGVVDTIEENEPVDNENNHVLEEAVNAEVIEQIETDVLDVNNENDQSEINKPGEAIVKTTCQTNTNLGKDQMNIDAQITEEKQTGTETNEQQEMFSNEKDKVLTDAMANENVEEITQKKIEHGQNAQANKIAESAQITNLPQAFSDENIAPLQTKQTSITSQSEEGTEDLPFTLNNEELQRANISSNLVAKNVASVEQKQGTINIEEKKSTIPLNNKDNFAKTLNILDNFVSFQEDSYFDLVPNRVEVTPVFISAEEQQNQMEHLDFTYTDLDSAALKPNIDTEKVQLESPSSHGFNHITSNWIPSDLLARKSRFEREKQDSKIIRDLMNDTLDDLESLLEEQALESQKSQGWSEQKKTNISTSNSFEILEDTFACKKVKETNSPKISKTSSFEFSEDVFETKKVKENKTPKISKTASMEILEESYGCKNSLELVKPMKSKKESKSKIKKRLKFLSKIYLKARCQFHQHFKRTFFVRFAQLFSI